MLRLGEGVMLPKGQCSFACCRMDGCGGREDSGNERGFEHRHGFLE